MIILKEGYTNFERDSHSMQYIDANLHSTSSGVNSLAIALIDGKVNGQVIVTEPQKYTEEVPKQIIGVADSVQHIHTTSYSSSSNKATLPNSANDIKDNTYYIKENETFDQASYKAMANDDVRSKIILESEL